jgi:hypothetical protein
MFLSSYSKCAAQKKEREVRETRETESPPTSGMIVSDGQCLVHAKSTLLGDQARQWAYHPTKMQSPFFQQLAGKKKLELKMNKRPPPTLQGDQEKSMELKQRDQSHLFIC